MPMTNKEAALQIIVDRLLAFEPDDYLIRQYLPKTTSGRCDKVRMEISKQVDRLMKPAMRYLDARRAKREEDE